MFGFLAIKRDVVVSWCVLTKLIASNNVESYMGVEFHYMFYFRDSGRNPMKRTFYVAKEGYSLEWDLPLIFSNTNKCVLGSIWLFKLKLWTSSKNIMENVLVCEIFETHVAVLFQDPVSEFCPLA